MTMNRLAIALSLPIGAALLLQANPSHALTVNVGGTDYDIQLFSGSLADFQTSGLSLPWFNSIANAELFANAYAALDTTQQNTIMGPSGDYWLGPLFYTLSSPETFVAWNNGGSAPDFDDTPFVTSYECGPDTMTAMKCSMPSTQWAYSQPAPSPATVPAPLPLLGATAAFSFSRKLRRRLSAQKFTF